VDIMNETTKYDSISCQSCRQAIDELEESEVYWTLRARQVYQVGKMARADMGHAMFHTRTGRIALCKAQRRDEEPARPS
jgi:hypothetical protein